MLDVNKYNALAESKRKENKEFTTKLRKKKPKDLDAHVHAAHNDAFEKIDCLDCANCCKSISPIIIDKDIDRIAKFFKMKRSEAIDQYFRKDEDNDYVFQQTPCPFLMPDNYCMIYEARPRACKEYPHTDRNRFYQILNLTFQNTFVCPAVYEVVEDIKKKY